MDTAVHELSARDQAVHHVLVRLLPSELAMLVIWHKNEAWVAQLAAARVTMLWMLTWKMYLAQCPLAASYFDIIDSLEWPRKTRRVMSLHLFDLIGKGLVFSFHTDNPLPLAMTAAIGPSTPPNIGGRHRRRRRGCF